MERQLVAKPRISEAKTNDYRPFNFGRKPQFPNREILHSAKHLSNRLQLSPVRLQTKLEISQPGDEYEEEADRVADMVMRMPEPKVQRQVEEEKDEEEQTLQAKDLPGQVPVTHGQDVPPIVHEVLRSSGQPLDTQTRAFMEPRFGHDFSKVRVHADEKAAESARAVNARAYTVGKNLVFGAGQYTPSTDVGQRLLAHELTHVVQQEHGRSIGVIQRAEVDDRSCVGLIDIEPDINARVNSEIAAARAVAGSPPALLTLLREVAIRLGGRMPISPLETFIENLPTSKRRIPPTSLTGTKYSGVGDVKSVYKVQSFAHVVGSAVKIHGLCVGADKLGHFFQQGADYFEIMIAHGGSTAAAESAGRALEIGIQGLSSTGVYSRADQAANLAGSQFYKDLKADPSGFKFSIKDYITDQWSEQANPSFYELGVGRVVWCNLLTGAWQGGLTNDLLQQSISSKVELVATTSSVTGKYEWPVIRPTHKGKIKNGAITQKTTSVSGTIPGESPESATSVSGISIEFDWEEVALEGEISSGKGKWDSVNEQALAGTWGIGSSRTNGGIWNLTKI